MSGIAEVRKIGVVELQIAQAARREIGDLGAIGGGQIVVEILKARIDRLADRFAPAAEMQHRRRWDADLRRASRGLLEEIEVGTLNRSDPLHLAADMHGWRLEPDLCAVVLPEVGGEFPVGRLDALEALKKIDVKEGAAKLAVGDPLQAYILLGAHDFANARVLDCVQLGGGQAASGETLARFPEPLGAKETPDMVGAKRWTGHGLLPRAFLSALSMCHDDLRVGNRPRPSP